MFKAIVYYNFVLMKRGILRFNYIFFRSDKNSTWTFFFKKIFKEKKKLNIQLKIKEKKVRIDNLFKNLKEIGNFLFKQNKYKFAIDMYTIALILVPFDKILDRSLNFSNRAQCLIFLDNKIKSLMECIGALKLHPKHDKSWYRKILVSKRFKDYVSCSKIILNVQSLSVKFIRNHTCVQNEFYGKNIIRLGNVSLKKKRGFNRVFVGKNFQLKPFTLDFFPSVLPILMKVTSITLIFIKALLYHNNILENIFFSRYYSKNLTKIAFCYCFVEKKIKIPSFKPILVYTSKLLLENSTLFKIDEVF